MEHPRAARLSVISGILFATTLFVQSYFIPRESFVMLLLCWGVMIMAYLMLLRYFQPRYEKNYQALTVLLLLIPIACVPPLSNDAYRFLWDGECWSAGINPYDFKPNEFGHLLVKTYFKELYQGMGALSQENYSCYPVINQLYFRLAAMCSDQLLTNLIMLRMFMLLTLVSAFPAFKRLLQSAGVKTGRHWYLLLHPLLVIEAVQNLHFEGVMLAFVVLALDALNRRKWITGGFTLAIAVQIKIIPLLILPFLLRWLGWKISIWVGTLVLALSVLLFFPLLNLSNYEHFLQSLALYFRQFEFNSAILHWYIEYGQWRYGYNRIQSFGPYLSQLSAKVILILAWYGDHFDLRQLMHRLFWAFSVYYLLTGTLHPWYLLTPLLFGSFTAYRFVWCWSVLAFLSYSFYAPGFETWFRYLTLLEYGVVLLFLIQDLYRWFNAPTIQNKAVSLRL